MYKLQKASGNIAGFFFKNIKEYRVIAIASKKSID
jgi:hypothetical protein